MKSTTLLLVLLVAILACVVNSERGGRGRSRGRASGFRGRFRNWRNRGNAGPSATNNDSEGSTGSDMSSGSGTDMSSGTANDVSSVGNKSGAKPARRGWNVPGGAFSGLGGLRKAKSGGRGGRPGGNSGFFRRRNNKNRMPPGITFNRWERQISDAVNVMENAVVNSTGQTITFMSADRRLQQEEIQRSVSAYDFEKNMVAVRTTLDGQRVCALVPVSIVTDFTSTVDDLKTRTMDTPVSPTTLVGDFLFIEDDPMTIDLQSSSPFLSRFCNRKRPTRPGRPEFRVQPAIIIDARTEADSMVDMTGTPSVTVMTINGKVTIHKTTSAAVTRA